METKRRNNDGTYKAKMSISNKRKRIPQSAVIFSQDSINELKATLDHRKIISSFVAMRSVRNGDMVGRCPFCRTKTENTKHFRVGKSGKWKCFECGIGGRTAVGFIKCWFNIAFDKAVHLAIRISKVDIKMEIVGKTRERHFPTPETIVHWRIRQLENELCTYKKIPRVKRSRHKDEDNLPF